MSIFNQIVDDQMVQACWIIRHLMGVKPILCNKFNRLLHRALNCIADNVLFISEKYPAEISDKVLKKKLKDIYCMLTQPRDEDVYHEFEKMSDNDPATYKVITQTGWGALCRIDFINLIENTKFPKRLAIKWVRAMQNKYKYFLQDDLQTFIERGEKRNQENNSNFIQ